MSDVQEAQGPISPDQMVRTETVPVAAAGQLPQARASGDGISLLVVDKNRPTMGILVGNPEHVEIPAAAALLLAELLGHDKRQNDQPALVTPSSSHDRKTRLPREMAKAMALVLRVLNPGWSNQQVADAVGYSLRQLLRWKEYARLSKASKGEGRLPRGTKDGDTGTVEAWAEDDDEDDM